MPILDKTIGKTVVSSLVSISDSTSPPMVIKDYGPDKVTWLLSFAGPNPEADERIELPEKQCWWLYEKIMKIDPL